MKPTRAHGSPSTAEVSLSSRLHLPPVAWRESGQPQTHDGGNVLKILLATDTYHPQVNGAAYFTQRMARQLAGRGHQVAVVAPSRSFSNTSETDECGVTTYGIRSIPLSSYPNLRASPPFLARTAIDKAIRATNPDVIHIQNHFLIGKYVAAAARRAGTPVVGTNHFMPENIIIHLPLPKFTAPAIKWIMWREFRKVYEQLDLVTAPSVAATTMLSTIGLRRPALIVSNGIDLSQFHPGTDDAHVREKYGLPDRPTLLFVGRLDEEKCLCDLLRAVPLIRRTREVHVVIAGTGPHRGALERIVGELGIVDDVTFTGFIPDADLPSLYRVADVFVMPGIAELQSIATMEAMAAGLPVLAADAVALPELVHHGENGFLFPPGDSAMLAWCAVGLLSDETLRRQMGRSSCAIIENHAIGHVAARLEGLYREAMSKQVNATAPARTDHGRRRPLLLARAAAALALGVTAATSGALYTWHPAAAEARQHISGDKDVQRIENIWDRIPRE